MVRYQDEILCQIKPIYSQGTFMPLLQTLFSSFHNLVFIGIALVGIGFLIGFHELGHFLFCKLFGIRTPSFSIGFGPHIFSKKIGDTQFSLSAIPLGGYVEIAGSAEVGQGDQKDAHSKAPDSFGAKPFYQKLLVMFGGILFNLAFAYFVFVLLFMTGIPKTNLLYPRNAMPVVASIKPDSAAARIDVQENDTLIALDGELINGDIVAFLENIKARPGQDIMLTIERDGTQYELPVTLESITHMGKLYGSLGILFEQTNMPALGLIESFKQGVTATNTFIMNTFAGIITLIKTRDVSQAAGPLQLIGVTKQGAQQGIKIFLLFLAVISINLAILNLVPLPVLDGGQILFLLIETIIRRPIPIKIREYIHIASWLMLMALIIYISYQDVMRWFTK